MPDLTIEVAEFRRCLDAFQLDSHNMFPRMAAYLDGPCERILKRMLDLVRVHADRIRLGSAPRISALCRMLPFIARQSAEQGQQVCRDHHHIDGKFRANRIDAHQHARWLGWLISDALRAGRWYPRQESNLAVDVLGLARELVDDMPWTKLPKDSLRHRVGLVRWFGDEVQRIAGLPCSRPNSSSNRPAQTSTARITPAGPSRDTSDAGGTRSATEHV